MFGDGVVAQVVLSDLEKGDYQSISWGWGLGVMLGVYASGISGAHMYVWLAAVCAELIESTAIPL